MKREMFAKNIIIFISPRKVYSGQTSKQRTKYISKEVKEAFDSAFSGNINDAMIQNGLLYCDAYNFNSELIKTGQNLNIPVGLSGTGPSFIGLLSETETETETE
ncbi:MAG: hypothetical protein GX362_02010, partial [Methanosarcinaceae archaeon]|nr:hypothetical protein [Methanosarcinaceae archaeon]